MKMPTQILTILNQDQLDSILSHMSPTDWWSIGSNFAAQLIAVGIAAFSGFYFQRMFKRADVKDAKIKSIYAFNEAAAYVGVLLENYVTRLETLIVPAVFSDSAIYQNIKTESQRPGPSAGILVGTFKAIWPIDVLPTEFLTKVSTVGKHVDLALAFNRLRHSMVQSAQICDERNFQIRQFILMPKNDITNIMLRSGEILNLTESLLMNEESIFDAAMYITQGLVKIGEELKSDLATVTKEKHFIAKMAPNPLYDEALKKVNEIVDKNPEFAGRFLHLRHTEIAGAIVKDEK